MRYTFFGSLIIAALLMIAVSASAADKTSSGIYLTADDFKNGKLSYEGWSGDSSHKLELHDVLDKPYIHVKHGNDTQKFNKSDIYGFRDSNGRSYRFIGNKEYEIRDTAALYIYSMKHSARNPKGAPIGIATSYFFSVAADGNVIPLTIANLKNTFPENHKLHDSLDMMFKNDSQLTQVDDFHKMFKVNRVILASSDR